MQFFILIQEPVAGHQTARTDALKADGTTYGDAPRCEACGKHTGMRQWLPPYRVELETWGSEFADVAITGIELLVSLYFKQAWDQSGLVGLRGFEDVEGVKRKRHQKIIGEPPAYFRAIVSRSETAIDLAASGFQWVKPPTCPTCCLGDIIKRWQGIVIDEHTWTGEDVFIARGLPGEIIVSERFKTFCDQNSMKGIVLLPAETYGHDFYPSQKGVLPTNDVDRQGKTTATIIGVHPVEAQQPCHLIELKIGRQSEPFDWGAVTQETPGQPRSNWQVAYDETSLDDEGTRWTFFFHYLDFSNPMLTLEGSLKLPTPTPMPEHLKHIKYEEP